MSTNYPTDSLGKNDQKNQKVAAIIFIVGFIVLHVLAFVIPAHPRFSGYNYAVTGVAVAGLIWLVANLWTNANLTEDNKWPHILTIILAFSSAVLIGYCPSC